MLQIILFCRMNEDDVPQVCCYKHGPRNNMFHDNCPSIEIPHRFPNSMQSSCKCHRHNCNYCQCYYHNNFHEPNKNIQETASAALQNHSNEQYYPNKSENEFSTNKINSEATETPLQLDEATSLNARFKLKSRPPPLEGAISTAIPLLRRHQYLQHKQLGSSSIATTMTTLSPLSLSSQHQSTNCEYQQSDELHYCAACSCLREKFLVLQQQEQPLFVMNKLKYFNNIGSIDDSDPDGTGSVITTMTQSTNLDNHSADGPSTPKRDEQHVIHALVHLQPSISPPQILAPAQPQQPNESQLTKRNNVVKQFRIRRIASGLHIAQSQAMTVAGFLPNSLNAAPPMLEEQPPPQNVQMGVINSANVAAAAAMPQVATKSVLDMYSGIPLLEIAQWLPSIDDATDVELSTGASDLTTCSSGAADGTMAASHLYSSNKNTRRSSKQSNGQCCFFMLCFLSKNFDSSVMRKFGH